MSSVPSAPSASTTTAAAPPPQAVLDVVGQTRPIDRGTTIPATVSVVDGSPGAIIDSDGTTLHHPREKQGGVAGTDDEHVCPITYVPFCEIPIERHLALPCGHMYDSEALEKAWTMQELHVYSCPLCRFIVHDPASVGIHVPSNSTTGVRGRNASDDDDDDEETHEDSSDSSYHDDPAMVDDRDMVIDDDNADDSVVEDNAEQEESAREAMDVVPTPLRMQPVAPGGADVAVPMDTDTIGIVQHDDHGDDDDGWIIDDDMDDEDFWNAEYVPSDSDSMSTDTEDEMEM